MKNWCTVVAASVLAAGLVLVPVGAAADELLNGRDVRLLIGLKSGSYQVYGQLFGKYLKRHLPESDVTVETDDRAAGKMVAKRVLEAPEGRLVLGMLSNNLLYEYMLGDADSQYVFAPAEFNWVGRFAENSRVLFASSSSGLRTLEAMQRQPEPLFVPTVKTVMSQTYQETLMLNAVLDLHLRPVPGYGGKATDLALLSGEGQAYNGTYLGSQALVESGDLVPVLKLGSKEWHDGLESLSTLRQAARPGYSKVVDFIEFCAEVSRWLVASPNITPEELASLRAAFDAVVSDSGFVQELNRANAPLSPLPGEELEARVLELFGDPEPYRAALKKAAACGQRRAEDVDEDC